MNWSEQSFWYTDMFTHPSFYLGTLILSVIAYLIGSINAGQLLSLSADKDLGKGGTGNFGATNAGRLYGAKAFVMVFLFDMLKAIFAALILTIIVTYAPKINTNNKSSLPEDTLFYYASVPLAMIFVVVGHSWPIYFNFKGGKGVATSFGSVIALNWAFALIAISIFGIFLFITRRTSLGSLFGSVSGSLLVISLQWIFPTFLLLDWASNCMSIVASGVLGTIVVIKHRGNISRIINGEDSFIKHKKNGK